MALAHAAEAGAADFELRGCHWCGLLGGEDLWRVSRSMGRLEFQAEVDRGSV